MEVVYISPVIQFSWAYKNLITNPPIDPDQRPNHLSFISLTHWASISPCTKSPPGPGTGQLETTPVPAGYQQYSDYPVLSYLPCPVPEPAG